MRLARLFLLLVAAAAAHAQQAPSRTTKYQQARAIRADKPPVIDGADTDDVWTRASANSDFLEFQPTEGKAARFKTEFKVAYDDRNLYVFIRAFDPHPDSIMTALTRRDVRGPSDQLKVMIDSYNDKRSGFEFAVNPNGVKRDYAMYNDNSEDQAWDGVWNASTKIDSLGWTAEYQIPFSQLRYANASEHVFGFAIWRDIERFKERTSWPLYRSSQAGMSSQMGELEGIRDITPFHRLEVVPYAVAKNVSVAKTAASASESPWGRSQQGSVGADVKYGITPNLTLDATVNPDFGQVEADPSVVNLTAFESFFQERRPFFVEGTGLYNFGINCSIVTCNSEGLFYSRRIGRSPQLFNRYADAASPNASPILGAGKLTGRVGNGFSVGVLEAVTGRVEGMLGRTTEPKTSYTVLRAQQDLRDGQTSVGVIATGVNRALDQWSDAYLRRDAYVVGSSLTHRWSRSRYELTANASRSVVNGSRQSVFSTQTNSVHLYQQADAGQVLDSTRTSLTGDEEQITFGKFGGNMIHFQSAYDRRSAGYEINDLGYLRRANQQTFNNWMQFAFRTPTSVYRSMTANINAWEYWTISGLQIEQAVNTNWHVNLQNNMWVHFGGTINKLGSTYSDNAARGGPAVRIMPQYNYNVGWQGDDRRHVVPMLFVNAGNSDGGRSHYLDISPELQLVPMSQLQFDITGDWYVNHDHTQWFGNFQGAGLTHYSFARLEQHTRSLGVRVSYTASPTLSLQVYTAPFVSRGQYSAVRELSADPRSMNYDSQFIAYTPPAGTSLGFDVLQLRSTSLVRWEFRPGSTLFAVWTHGRDGYDPAFSERGLRADYNDLFALHPNNTFLLKMAYWLN
ncbi:MAG: hypothetical protein JWM95_87 [Gemmatimonadetes bacterium]|nr:hypothetical protein [Gemmatimonadota bacterium]